MALLQIILIALQVMDGATTYASVRMGAVEANPIMGFAIRVMGLKWAVVTTKVAVVALVFNSSVTSLIVVDLVYVVVLINNLHTIASINTQRKDG
jgi:hypothetical protein